MKRSYALALAGSCPPTAAATEMRANNAETMAEHRDKHERQSAFAINTYTDGRKKL